MEKSTRRFLLATRFRTIISTRKSNVFIGPRSILGILSAVSDNSLDLSAVADDTVYISDARAKRETKLERYETMYKTNFQRDHTITVWDIYTQSWLRTGNPSDRILASLSEPERSRVIRHCGL